MPADKLRQAACFLINIGIYFFRLPPQNKEKLNFTTTVKQTINFYEFKPLSKEEWPYFEQLRVFLEFLYNEEVAVELFVRVYRKLVLVKAELERECRGLLFLCLSHFTNKLKLQELMDLVFEEWQVSTVVERNWSYDLVPSFFCETVKILTIRKMDLEVFTLFK